jgi:RHH-type proline utilization regulon transcriptional repressor/proline dehydrogenase/delta 1-pyrroline-5-carboxylate dehydrogenase
LLENGANTSFVNRIADSTIAVESVVADPVAAAQSNATAANPKIPLPRDLYGDRVNSAGFVFADEAASSPVLAKIASFASRPLERVADATPADAHRALEIASRALIPPAPERARILERAADLMRRMARGSWRFSRVRPARRCPTASVRCAKRRISAATTRCSRAGTSRSPKSSPDPRANRTGWSSWGADRSSASVPWNFPLAIFVGQVSAAFAAGNPVVAKPAEQTPLIASAAVETLLEAGVPRDALALIPGPGETVGAALVSDPRTAGVAFTGSTATARAINRALAARDGPIVPFIAETGALTRCWSIRAPCPSRSWPTSSLPRSTARANAARPCASSACRMRSRLA